MEQNKSLIDLSDIRKLFKIVFKNWYFLLGIPLLAGVIAYFYTHKLTDYYGAKSQILLKSQEIYDYQSQMFRSLGYYEAYQDVTNQIRVIKSYDIIDETLKKIHFDVSYYIEGRVKTTEFFKGMPFEVKIKNISSNLYETPIYLKILDTQRYEITIGEDDEKIVRVYPFNKEIVENEYIWTISKQNTINEKTLESLKEIKYFFKVHDHSSLVYKYKELLKVTHFDYTSIIELYVEDNIPERAVMFLDSLAKTFIDYSLKNRIEVNDKTIKYINRQLQQVTELLNQIEEEFENYRETKAILDLSKEEEQYFQNLVKYEGEERELLMKIESIEALEDYILNSKDDKFLPPSLYVLDDMFLQTSLNELYNLQMQRNANLFKTTEQNMNIGQIDENIKLLKKNILIYLNNTKQAIETKLQNIRKEVDYYANKIKQLPKTQLELLNIERKRQINEKLYMMLLEKRENAIIARAGIIPQTKIIEKARNIGVVRPNKIKIFYTFLLGGFLLGLVIAIIRVFLFDTIESVEELSEHTDVTILSGIPYNPKLDDSSIFVLSNPKSGITEAFRTIRTNLHYLNPNAKHKIVLISSLLPGEGKTFTSTNLSAILAKAQKKVLLIDFDLHKPKVHKIFKEDNLKGASSWLVGDESIEDIKKPLMDGYLDVIFAGPVPPNASELILSDRIPEEINRQKEKYDYIILDTPPIGLISDANVLMRYTNINIFVLNSDVLKPGNVKAINKIIETNKTDNNSFGIVMNKIRFKRLSYYYNKYSYGYGYGSYGGYGYGGYGKNKYGYRYGYGEKQEKT